MSGFYRRPAPLQHNSSKPATSRGSAASLAYTLVVMENNHWASLVRTGFHIKEIVSPLPQYTFFPPVRTSLGISHNLSVVIACFPRYIVHSFTCLTLIT